MEQIQRELEQVNKKLVEAEKIISQSEGSVNTLTDRLKQEFNLPDEIAAEEEVKNLTAQQSVLGHQIQEKFSELRKQYKW
jgi:uncharacterized coiled-coil protein SlyX